MQISAPVVVRVVVVVGWWGGEVVDGGVLGCWGGGVVAPLRPFHPHLFFGDLELP